MRNKSYIAILCLILFVGIWLMYPQVTRAENEKGVVTASLLNVRTDPSIPTDGDNILVHGEVKVQLENGTEVTILEKLDGWYYVSFTYSETELKGYVSSQYIAIETVPTATPEPTVTPEPTERPYRYVTTYKEISAKATIAKKSAIVRKKANGKQKAVLAKDKKVTIVGEKTVENKKWFKISYKYKKVAYTGYVENTDVKMTLKKYPYALITNVKKAAKVREKAGSDAAYKLMNGKKIKLPLGTEVSILKEKTVKNKKWYRISFTYNKKTVKGYLNSQYVKLSKKKIVKKTYVYALTEEEFEKSLTDEGFPDSYKQGLRKLHEMYPYWQFKAFKTGLDWAEALKNESVIGVNLISNNKSKAWKSTKEGAYDKETGTWKVFDGTSWVAASKKAIAYYMDPRNFLNERTIYMFECLEYQSQYQVKSGVNTIIANTPFYKKKFTYKDLETGKETTTYYASAFMAAAKHSGVSPYHLASRVKQEVVTSPTTTSIAATGTNAKYPGIYNFYNIGATSGANPAQRGLGWASKGTTYLRPWTDPYRSILGGAEYIGTGYIKKGQNTGYLQKFNVTANETYSHQYMTNVEAAYAEAIKTKSAYAGTIDQSPLVFSIPIYENMPAENCKAPG